MIAPTYFYAVKLRLADSRRVTVTVQATSPIAAVILAKRQHDGVVEQLL